MKTIMIHLEDDDVKELRELCLDRGVSVDAFITSCVRRALEERRISCEQEDPDDPFYSERNMAWLRFSDQQLREGRVVEKTMEELRALEDGTE